MRHRGGVKAVAFHPNGKSVFTCEWNGTVRQWDVPADNLTAGVQLTDEPVHGAKVDWQTVIDNPKNVAISADGQWLVAGVASVLLHAEAMTIMEHPDAQ